MNKNIIIVCLISSLIFFTGCVEENETSIEIPSTNITPAAMPTVNETPVAEVTSTPEPEPSEIWPKYMVTYDRLTDITITYSNGQKVTVTEVLEVHMNPPDLKVLTSDFKLTSYDNAVHKSVKVYKVTREISRETYEKYEKILAEDDYRYPSVSVHIIYEPTPIVMDESMQEIVDFLNEDKTNELEYREGFHNNQIVFAKQLSKNASEHNLSFGVIIFGRGVFIQPDDFYAFNCFNSSGQMYFVDPVTDRLVTVCEVFDYGHVYGKIYPPGANLPLNRIKKVRHNLNMSEFCDQRDLTIPIDTQTTAQTPTSTPEPTSTTEPTSTPTPDVMPEVEYVLYQNAEYGYGFEHPNNWIVGDVGLTNDMLQGVSMSHDTPGNGNMLVVVYSSDPKSLWDEMGGLDVLTQAGFVTTRSSTVNGHAAFEVLSTENFMPGTTVRYVIIQANGYYYMMTLYMSDETYSTQPDKFDDIVNSWVIENIE